MNGNPYTSTFIGATGEYPIYKKIIDTSNILEQHSSNFTSNTSNTLKNYIDSNLITSSNYTSITSNALKGFIDNNLITSSNFTTGTSNALKHLINDLDTRTASLQIETTGHSILITEITGVLSTQSGTISGLSGVSAGHTISIAGLSLAVGDLQSTKQDELSFTYPLSNTLNDISIDLSSYSTTDGMNTAISTASTNNSNFTTETSNILKGFIDGNLTTSSNFTTETSNILKGFIDANLTTSSNFTTGTSNTL